MWEPPLNACFFHLAARPECTSDPECPISLACIQEKCQDPCFTTTCGLNAQCTANNHRALCICKSGYVGDPYTICEERKYFILFFIFFKTLQRWPDKLCILTSKCMNKKGLKTIKKLGFYHTHKRLTTCRNMMKNGLFNISE